MTDGQQMNQFRALDFDEEDILFSPLVRYHFEREAMEDLQKLNAGEFEAAPKEAALAKKRAEKYYRRSQRCKMFRHGYHILQKVSVFLVVLAVGFTFLTVRVDAVNKAVVSWLTEIYQTHTHLSVVMEDSYIDFSNVKINWIPPQTTLDRSLANEGYYSVMYQQQSIGSIALYQSDTNISVNTEDATVTDLQLPGFDRTMLVERQDGIILLASNQQLFIKIALMTTPGYFCTTGELLQILQNIEY